MSHLRQAHLLTCCGVVADDVISRDPGGVLLEVNDMSEPVDIVLIVLVPHPTFHLKTQPS